MRFVVCVNASLDPGFPVWPADQGRALAQGLGSAEPGTGLSAPGAMAYHITASARAAVEVALGLSPAQVTAVVTGGPEVEGALAWCRARGIPDTRHVDAAHELWSCERIAASVAGLLRELEPNVVFCGACGDRGGSGTVPPYIAELLGWPYVEGVLAAELGKGSARVVRRLPRGWREEVESSLPVVLGIDAAAASPRYVSVQSQERARRIGATRTMATRGTVEPELVSFSTARPRPKTILAPDGGQSAEDRIRFMLSGGVQKKQGAVMHGDAAKQVAELIDFLGREGILD